MKNTRILFSFLAFLTIASMPAQYLQATAGVPAWLTVAGCIALAIVGRQFKTQNDIPGLVKNGVEVEVWVDAIVKRFWKDNLFLKLFKDHSQYVLAGKIVHIPQQGTKPTVIKGRTTFPGTAVRRTDTDLTYTLDEYSTDPTHITNTEAIELSYDKIMDVFGDHAAALAESAADDFIIKLLTLLPGTNVISTTGASTAVGVTGQTGTRKAAIHNDLRALSLKMNIANVPKQDRYALLEANMQDQIFGSLSETQYRDFTRYADAATGVLGKLYGITILDRSSVAIAASALNGSSELVVRALGASVGATDDAVSLIWQKDCAAHAIGETKFFENKNDALYFGDVYSATLRNGGRRLRADSAGVYALKQGATS